jgi:hypothetical protein
VAFGLLKVQKYGDIVGGYIQYAENKEVLKVLSKFFFIKCKFVLYG